MYNSVLESSSAWQPNSCRLSTKVSPLEGHVPFLHVPLFMWSLVLSVFPLSLSFSLSVFSFLCSYRTYPIIQWISYDLCLNLTVNNKLLLWVASLGGTLPPKMTLSFTRLYCILSIPLIFMVRYITELAAFRLWGRFTRPFPVFRYMFVERTYDQLKILWVHL